MGISSENKIDKYAGKNIYEKKLTLDKKYCAESMSWNSLDRS